MQQYTQYRMPEMTFKGDSFLKEWTAKAENDTVNPDGTLTVCSPDQKLHNLGKNFPASDHFTVEFRIKINSYAHETGFKLEYATRRIFLYFRPAGIHFGSVSKQLDDPLGWHTYRIEVIDGFGTLTLDGVLLGKTELQDYKHPTHTATFFVWGDDKKEASLTLDYLTYTPIFPAIEIFAEEDGDGVALSATVHDPDLKPDTLEYCVNGMPLDESDRDLKLHLEDLIPGVYTVDARYEETVSKSVRFTYKMETAKPWAPVNRVLAPVGDHLTSVLLTYTAKDGAVLTYCDGVYGLDVAHTATDVTVCGKTYPFANGTCRFYCDGGVCDFYYNGQLADSLRLPVTEQAAGITSNIEDLVTQQWNDTVFSADAGKVFTTLPPFSQEYALEFDHTTGNPAKISLCDGVYALSLQFDGNTCTAVSSPLRFKTETETLCTLPEGKHHYRLAASKGITQLFAENQWLASLRLPEGCGPRILNADTDASYIRIRTVDDLYFFEDRFDGATELASKNYWRVKNGEMTLDGALTLTATDYATATLAVYGEYPNITAEIDVPASGTFGIALREIEPHAGIFVGYDTDENAWFLRTTGNQDVHTVQGAKMQLSAGETVTVQTMFDTATKELTVLCNGTEVLKTANLQWHLCGHIGIGAEQTTVTVHSFRYQGDAKVCANEYIARYYDGNSPEIMELGDTVYMSLHSELAWRSDDDGYTWNKVPQKHFTSNMIRLQSGKILSIERFKPNPNEEKYYNLAYISADNGKTWDNGNRIQPNAINRIAMNNKTTQDSTGRIYFASNETGHAEEDAGAGHVYYSDDDGVTWTGAKNMLSCKELGVNLQEIKAIELPDGRIRMYMRTDRGFLYYSDSFDRGETWDTNLKKTEFIAPLCAFNIEKDPESSDYYMTWEYNNKNDHNTIQCPRTRVVLAVSRDLCKTWQFVADIDHYNIGNVFVHMNEGIRVTKNAVFCNVVSNLNKVATMPKGLSNHTARIEKSTIRANMRMPKVPIFGQKEPTADSLDCLANTIVISKDGSKILVRETVLEVEHPVPGTLPLAALATYFNARAINGILLLGKTKLFFGGDTVPMDLFTESPEYTVRTTERGNTVITTTPDEAMIRFLDLLI